MSTTIKLIPIVRRRKYGDAYCWHAGFIRDDVVHIDNIPLINRKTAMKYAIIMRNDICKKGS